MRPADPARTAWPQQLSRVPEALRPRLTGRAAILVLVLAVLAVSYASSMRAYFEQRSHIADLQDEIEERRAAIDDLEKEKQRWDDPAFVTQQARARFGYLRPGETAYVVLGEDGEPLEGQAELTDPDSIAQPPPASVYGDLWESVQLAGDPPRQEPPPANEIGGSRRSTR